MQYSCPSLEVQVKAISRYRPFRLSQTAAQSLTAGDEKPITAFAQFCL